MTDTESTVAVCVHGLGHIGLPTALLLAESYDVCGIDIDESVVEQLRAGESPIDEPGIEELLRSTDRFSVRTDPVPAEVHIVAVPTPLDRATNVADLTAIKGAVRSLGTVLRPGDTVIVESTVPPGTTERLVKPLVTSVSGLDSDEFAVAYCPERAIPGETLSEMRQNDRIAGVTGPAVGDRVVALYDGFVEGTIHRTTPTTAEFVKLVENTQRDVDIALANEFALMAESLGIDVHEARSLANKHPRIDVLRPGPGVGGHCITVDPWFLSGTTATTRLLPVAREVNDTMPDHVLRLVRETMNGKPEARVAVLGAAYKGNVGDTRETPARRLCRRLENDGYEVVVADPHVESFEWSPVSIEDAVERADCAVLVTDHDVFRDLDPESLGSAMRHTRLVDTRGFLDHERWRAAGFDVTILGDGSTRVERDRR